MFLEKLLAAAENVYSLVELSTKKGIQLMKTQGIILSGCFGVKLPLLTMLW